MNKDDAAVMLNDMMTLSYEEFYTKYEPGNKHILKNYKMKVDYAKTKYGMKALEKMGKKDLIINMIADDQRFKNYKVKA